MSNVRSSVNKMIGVLNRFGDTLNANARQRILQALITPNTGALCASVDTHWQKADGSNESCDSACSTRSVAQ